MRSLRHLKMSACEWIIVADVTEVLLVGAWATLVTVHSVPRVMDAAACVFLSSVTISFLK